MFYTFLTGNEKQGLNSTMADIFLARQPIFDFEYKLHGYELLFRDGFTEQAEYLNEEIATSQVMLSSLIDMGIEKLTAGNDCYINISNNYIDDIDDVVDLPFGSSSITLEIDINNELSDRHHEVLTRLSSEGVKLAIDHFRPENQQASVLQLFDIIKCDTQTLTPEQLKQASQLAEKFSCKMIAINIENYQQISELQGIGIDYFQGFFLSKPGIKTQKSVPTVLLPVIKTLSRILDPELELPELEELISSDVSLSYRVLRLINSARYNIDEIDSISRAIVYLGREAIKNLTIIIILTGVDDKPTELSKLALIRAKMCEILAIKIELEDSSSYFSVGLLSVLDAMLDRPMEQVLNELNVNDELKQALLKQGLIGKTLQCVLQYENCSVSKENAENIESSELADSYLDAVAWAEETYAGLSLES